MANCLSTVGSLCSITQLALREALDGACMHGHPEACASVPDQAEPRWGISSPHWAAPSEAIVLLFFCCLSHSAVVIGTRVSISLLGRRHLHNYKMVKNH